MQTAEGKSRKGGVKMKITPTSCDLIKELVRFT